MDLLKNKVPFTIFDYDKIQFSEKIGSGANSYVYKGKIDDKLIAIKEYDKDDWEDHDEFFENLLYELDVAKKMEDSNYLMKTYGISIHDRNIYIIMEYLGKDDFYDFLQDKNLWQPCYKYNNIIIPEPENNYVIYNEETEIYWCFTMERNRKINISRMLIESLIELHERCIIHGDIKSNNMILQNEKVKLIDFGVSTIMDTNDTTSIERTYGTEGYMAPEQYKYYIGYQSDIYSLGVTLIEIWTGEIWEGGEAFKKCRNEVLKCVRKIEQNEKKYGKIIRNCLMMDMSKRPTAKRLLKLYTECF